MIKCTHFVSVRAYPHLSFKYGYAYGASKVLAIKSQASLVPSCICEHYPFMHYLSHLPRGKDACDLGEGVP